MSSKMEQERKKKTSKTRKEEERGERGRKLTTDNKEPFLSHFHRCTLVPSRMDQERTSSCPTCKQQRKVETNTKTTTKANLKQNKTHTSKTYLDFF